MEDLDVTTWTGRRILVTGATGFLGSWLVPGLLEKGAHVTALVLDRDPQSELIRSGTLDRTTVVDGRLEDIETLERALVTHDIDTVFHLGAQTLVGAARRAPLRTFESNIRGTYNLLEVCRRHDDVVSSIVVASSDKAYGESVDLPYTEEMPPRGAYPYDASKACADLISQCFHATYGLPVVIARCGNIYGGGDLNWSRLIPGTIRSLYSGKPPVLRSDGTFRRDYIYVRDAVDAYLAMGAQVSRQEVRGEAFNFGPERPYTVLEVVEALRSMMGREDLSPIVEDRARAEIKDQWLDSTKAREVLGWNPGHTFEGGLKETIAWYQAYLGDAT